MIPQWPNEASTGLFSIPTSEHKGKRQIWVEDPLCKLKMVHVLWIIWGFQLTVLHCVGTPKFYLLRCDDKHPNPMKKKIHSNILGSLLSSGTSPSWKLLLLLVLAISSVV